ncbi:uncharacterized protein SCHCODRAFT_01142224 [Schizophyllum commune H4-8]|uniref:uncharacterized protein n=1 Tax=Schizophyllum commune (strain H4-8 / FGSC 9210) TaxID=578458 RepID=UPI00215F6A51|nr:uncharacterized protein SCHCODRAFT_01142224 [Schizophyllum commune H4-8]KAI5894147.1 hypothetical protein SCHCODRAFT_01142224 [Schizophyllum commune H4-8]
MPQEIQRISTLADDAERDASALAQEIDRLRVLVADMDTHRRQAVAFAAQQRLLVAPIRRLPTELLTQILADVCAEEITFRLLPRDSTRRYSFNTKPRPRYPAVVASHVCRRWRALLFDSPSLWIPNGGLTIGFAIGVQASKRSWKRTCASVRRAVDHYAERSSGLALELQVDDDTSSPRKSNDPQVIAVCGIIAKHLHRWRLIHMPVVVARCLHEYTDDAIPGLLEELSIPWFDAREHGDRRVSSVFLIAPRLRKVTAPQVERIDLPWDQLTNIRDNAWLSHEGAVEPLFGHRLQTLRIAIDHRMLADLQNTPHLTRLDLATDHFVEATCLLSCVSAPALTQLILRGAYPQMDDPEENQSGCNMCIHTRDEEDACIDAFLKFLDRSQCRLTYLRLHYLSLATPVFMQVLGGLSFLKSLIMIDPYYDHVIPQEPGADYDYTYEVTEPPSSISSDVFLAMMGSVDAQPILPRLEHFSYDGGASVAMLEGSIRPVVDRLCQSRTSPPLLFEVEGERISG